MSKLQGQQYHFDARGSTVLLTDSTGAVTDSFAYGPYGEAWGHTGYTSTPFQFNGKYGVTTDPNGLLCMRARFYHPVLRRFLNQDVLLGAISPGIALNRYAFANGRECPCRS
jgi:RHS repeat-associated protein